MVRLIFFCLLIALSLSCSRSGKRNPSLMQEATGRPGDMVLIMDSTQWKEALGQHLRGIFQAEVTGLPRPEPRFNVTWVHPNRNFRLLTQIRNLVYVFTLDHKTSGTRAITDNLSPQTIDTIRRDPGFYISVKQDQYARGQVVMYLFSNTEGQLIDQLEKNGQRIAEYFHIIERNRLVSSFRRTRTTRGSTEFLRKELQCEMVLPIGFQMADRRKDFIWFRNIEVDADKNVFISWKPYTSETQLQKENLIEWRNNIARRYLYEDPEQPNSYIVTETSVPFQPVTTKQVSMNSNYAVELKGLWKTNNNTMGGPFIGYSLIDEAQGLLYYIEGFAFSPGKDQREIMRELEAILWTFRTSESIITEETR